MQDQLDFRKRQEPEPGIDMRRLLEDWLRYQRGEFQRKLRDLTPEQMTRWSVPRSSSPCSAWSGT